MKSIFDQTAAWIGAIVSSCVLFAGVHYSAKYFATKHLVQNGEIEEKSEEKAETASLTEGPSHESSHQDLHEEKESQEDSLASKEHHQVSSENHAVRESHSSFCKAGQKQSPINLSGAVKAHEKLSIRPLNVDGMLRKVGQLLRLESSDKVEAVLGNKTYPMEGIEWYSPSLHRIEGTPYDLEMVMMYRDAYGEKLNISVLFEESYDNKYLKPIIDSFPSLTKNKDSKIQINTNKIIAPSSSYFIYSGSALEEPCSENVKWVVFQKPSSISSRQLDLYRTLFPKKNNRNVQATNGRKILLSNP